MIEALNRHGIPLAKFAVVGVANTVIDFCVFLALFYGLGWPLLVANTLGWVAGVTNSYLMNSRWTFHDPARRDRPARMALFAAFNFCGLLIANAVIWVLALLMPAWLAKIGAIGATLVWNYWSSHRFVFARV